MTWAPLLAVLVSLGHVTVEAKTASVLSGPLAPRNDEPYAIPLRPTSTSKWKLT
ncbi:hypothetical protein AB0F91_38470 [Amycolatopsis sp. NPDC023774]|uniref:hypothetical protein n=1 Tax=Amycolatopsis sp. NPDC023774 TaxID=3155015 RepID=UPI0033D91331